MTTQLATPFSNTVGLSLRQAEERLLVRLAARECGLAPVDLDPSLPLQTAFRGLPLIVTDQDWEDRGQVGLVEQDFRLVLRVLDEAESSDDAWALSRPLHAGAVRKMLHQSASTCRMFAARHYAMLEELHRSRRIFESVGNGISIADVRIPGLPVVYVNPAFERMTGFSAEEARGRNCRFLQGSDTDQAGLTEIRQAIAEQREARVLLRNYRKDGALFWNDLLLSPVRDLEGELRYFAGIQNDVTAQVETTQRLEHLAHHDFLTGLANRELLMKQLKQALAQARSSGRNIAVVFFDIDNLRHVNDVLGHDAGDRLLQVIAARLRAETRADEVIARLGGDEFVAVLEGSCDARWPQRAVQRLSSALSEAITLYEQPFHPSASVGMAVFPQDGDTAEALLKIADMQMYAAKHTARQALQNNEESLPDLS